MKHSAATLEASREVVQLLGLAIRSERIRRHATISQLADRVGISKPTMIRIEAGDPSVSIGRFFDAAIVMGIPLFDKDADGWGSELARARREAALLPARAVMPRVNDDF
jgi:transcriptional regulator with XRE-family HTH domain